MEQARHTPRPHLVLLVVGMGTLLNTLAGSSVNLALPVIGQELEITLQLLRWVMLAFLLVVSVLLLVAGRMSDLLGHRTVYQTGFVVFGVGSLVCSLAPSLGLLVAGRAIQGAGASMIMSAGPALLTSSFPGSRRGQALGILATVTYSGLTMGPPLGGLLIALAGWRWIFFFNVPVAAVMVAVGQRLLPAPGTASRGLLEPQGRQLLDLTLFSNRIFAGSVISALLNYVAIFVPIILLPFYLMEALGISPGRAGVVLAVMPLVMALVATPSGWLSDRIGTRWIAVLGMLVLAAGLMGLSTIGPLTTEHAVGLWLGCIGLGTGVFISPNSSALMGAAPERRQGTAASVLALARTLGMVLGIAGGTGLFRLAGGQTGQRWRSDDFLALGVAVKAAAGVGLIGAVASSMRGRKVAVEREV